MSFERLLPTQRRDSAMTPGLPSHTEAESESLPKKNHIVRNFAATLCAISFTAGSIYFAFRHKELSHAAVTSMAYLIGSASAGIALEENRILKSR